MADLKQNLKEGLRERFENNTGIVGDALRARREQKEKEKQIQNEVDAVQKVTSKLKIGGTTLTNMEKSFTQISENLQLIAKALNAQTTTFEETQEAYQSEQVQQRRKQLTAVQKIPDDTEEFSLFDRISNLIDIFERKRKKVSDNEKAKREAQRRAKEKAEAERKALEKNKEKTRADAEKAQKAAKEEARAAGKSTKQVEQAGRAAAKKVVKQASEAAIKSAARQIVLKNVGRLAWKAIPFVGTIAGVYFVIDALVQGNYTGAATETVSALTGPVGGAMAALPSMVSEVYIEVYGIDITVDAINDPEGAEKRREVVYKICKEQLLEALKSTAKRYAVRAAKTSMKAVTKQEAQNALASGESDEQLERQFEGGRAALEKVAGYTPLSKTPDAAPAEKANTAALAAFSRVQTQAPAEKANTAALAAFSRVQTIAQPTSVAAPVTGAKPASEEQVRAIAKAKVTSMKLGQVKLPEATVADAIKSAAERVNVDESIMLAMAQQESGFNPNAKAQQSSAKGLFQFIDSTWNYYVKKFAKIYPELLKGPLDPFASAIAGALYIKDNSEYLRKKGIPVTGTTIYAGHFLGAGGAVKLLSANPNAYAATIPGMEAPAEANQYIFYKPGANKKPDIGAPRTVQEVIEVLYKKVGSNAEQYAALQQNPSAGQNIAEVSTSVASAKKAQQTGSSITVVAINNNTQTKVGATNRPPQYQTTAVVGG